MTVIAMSRTEIDRMSVLQNLAANRIKVANAEALMRLGRRQVFQLAKAYDQHVRRPLVPLRRGWPSNRCYPTIIIVLLDNTINAIRVSTDFSVKALNKLDNRLVENVV